MRVFICVLVVGFMVCTGAYAALEDGLVGYWSFDSGGAKDDSGKNNNGIIHGNPKPVKGKFGMAFDFDGDDGVEIPHSATLNLPDKVTAAAWIYPRAIDRKSTL